MYVKNERWYSLFSHPNEQIPKGLIVSYEPLTKLKF